jgi:hypothetical protein
LGRLQAHAAADKRVLSGARQRAAKKTKALAECKADRSWRRFEATGTGHGVMVDSPDWLVDVPLQVS